VREELLARCRAERIEPPSAGRCDRIIRSALHQAEQALARQVTAQLGPDVIGRLAALAAAADDDKAGDADPSALALIKSVPGTVSLESMLTEIGKSSRSTTEPSIPHGSADRGGPHPVKTDGCLVLTGAAMTGGHRPAGRRLRPESERRACLLL
jgi:hypothetical protein